jgi:hypothetical protein
VWLFTRHPDNRGVFYTSIDAGVTWDGPVLFQDTGLGDYEYCSAIPYTADTVAVMDGQQPILNPNTAGPSQVTFRVLYPLQ